MGFCDSSDFSSLGVSADDFAVFFFVICRPLCVWIIRDYLLDMSMVMSRCLAAFMRITSNAIGSDGISLKFIGHVVHVFNHAITCSVFPTM
jgi:hypothetical protein